MKLPNVIRMGVEATYSKNPNNLITHNNVNISKINNKEYSICMCKLRTTFFKRNSPCHVDKGIMIIHFCHDVDPLVIFLLMNGFMAL